MPPPKRRAITGRKVVKEKRSRVLHDEEISEGDEESDVEVEKQRVSNDAVKVDVHGNDDDNDEEEEEEEGEGEEEDEEDEEESPDAKRLRLAKEYLAQLAEEEGEDDEVALGARLQREAMDTAGRAHRKVADKIRDSSTEDLESSALWRGHRLAVTCVALSEDDTSAFSGGKDGRIICYNTETSQKMPLGRKDVGHKGPVASLSVSSDGRYLASAGRDTTVRIWDLRTQSQAECFEGHNSPVTGVAFRVGTHSLYSSSEDKLVKVWNVDEMAYVETLFGHQGPILSIDSLCHERALTSARDRSVRLWKIVEGTHLVFPGHTASIDCVRFISEDTFVSAGEDGSICLWSVTKKKPVTTTAHAHGGHWISSLAAFRYGDLVVSGSSDGFIRMWKVDRGTRTLEPVRQLPQVGFVNGLALSTTGRFLLAGIGQEHRCGRWERQAQAKNGVRLFPINIQPIVH